MNRTVKMECAGCSEWADRGAIIAIEGQVYARRAIFCFWLRGCANPGTISDVVWCCHIIHEREGLTFVNGDGVLHEVEPGHVDLGATRARRFILDGTGSQESCHQAEYKQGKAYLCIHRSILLGQNERECPAMYTRALDYTILFLLYEVPYASSTVSTCSPIEKDHIAASLMRLYAEIAKPCSPFPNFAPLVPTY